MENFFVDGEFYTDIESLVESTFDEDEVQFFRDDFKILAFESKQEPLFSLSADFIIEAINEDMLSEDGDELEKVEKILNANIDFAKINALIPKMYYINQRSHFYITKQDLLEAL